ncbi:FecR domain-containing protein [Fluviicola sp.]|uniref:FecR family protein n=1 Tax=Fluviicola sp. TaxID=1917219 RepID=UPI00262513CE|nr:FecR domain-containing protein [Fluviicola sp.]
MKTIQDMDALIGKFLHGEASSEEAMFLEDWIAESHENKMHFEQSALAFGLVDKAVSTDRAWNSIQPQLKQAPVRKLSVAWIASLAAMLVISLGAAFYFFHSKEESTVFTAGKEEKKIELNDGTDIQLAAHSSVELSAAYGKKNRLVTLKGSGYFSVKHSKKRPFIIDAGPIHIKDLGTKFNVKTTEDTIYVRVDEGMVVIYDNKGMKLTLQANESAHYVIASGDLKLDVLAENLKKQYKTILLDNQRLEDVVDLLNKTYKVSIRIDNPALKDCRITTEFLNEDLDTVLMVISQTLEVTILKEKNNNYLIKGMACIQ